MSFLIVIFVGSLLIGSTTAVMFVNGDSSPNPDTCRNCVGSLTLYLYDGPTGGGTINGNSNGATITDYCSSDTEEEFSLTAVANSGYDFAYWSNGATTASINLYAACYPGDNLATSITAYYGLYNDQTVGWACNKQILANEPDGNFDNCPYKTVAVEQGYVETNPESSGNGLELQVNLSGIEYNYTTAANPAGYARASPQPGFGLINMSAQTFMNDNVWSNVSYSLDQSGDQWVDFTYDFFLYSGGTSYEIMVEPYASMDMDAICASGIGYAAYAEQSYSNIPTYLNGQTISPAYWLACYGSPSTDAGRWIAQFIPYTARGPEWIGNGLLAIDLSEVVSDAMSEFNLSPSSTIVSAIRVGSEYGAYYDWWPLDILTVIETVYLYSWTLSYSSTAYSMVN